MAKDDIRQILKEYSEETKRHFGVVAEDLRGEIRLVAEQVAANAEKLEEHDQRFDAIDQRFDRIENRIEAVESDVGVIKDDVAFIKNELTQKVSREEFVVLEKRLSLLETRVKQTR